jgi:hypothetical protein
MKKKKIKRKNMTISKWADNLPFGPASLLIRAAQTCMRPAPTCGPHLSVPRTHHSLCLAGPTASHTFASPRAHWFSPAPLPRGATLSSPSSARLSHESTTSAALAVGIGRRGPVLARTRGTIKVGHGPPQLPPHPSPRRQLA